MSAADEPTTWSAGSALPEAGRAAAGERGFAGTFIRRQVYGAHHAPARIRSRVWAVVATSI
jgi:hypothetical protein